MKHLQGINVLFFLSALPLIGQNPTEPTGSSELLKKGGPLRIYSSVKEPYKPLDITKATQFDDFIQAMLLKEGNWAALRRSGDVVSNHNSFDGMKGVAALTNKAILYKDGRVEIVGDGGRRIVAKEGGQELVSTAGLTIAIKEGGRIESWGRALQRETYEKSPDDLSGVVAVAATHGVIDSRSYAVRSNGTVVTWGEKSVKPILPERIPNIRQLDGGWNHFAALTNDGRVLAWPTGRRWTRVPTDLPPINKIKAQCNITAAQKEDLTWIAWGDDSMGIRNIIDQIGPALDISFEANGRGWGHVIWIEPKE